jgi:hypothetical protein
MYAVGYIFRVPLEKVDEFVAIQEAASTIYLSHGVRRDETYRVDLGGESRYGCLPLKNVIPINEREALFMGITAFANKAEYERLTPILDGDQKLEELFGKLTSFIDISRVIRFEMPLMCGNST